MCFTDFRGGKATAGVELANNCCTQLYAFFLKLVRKVMTAFSRYRAASVRVGATFKASALCFLATAIAAQPAYATSLTRGLVGYYTFDNQDFTDSSGHNHTGTARGPVTFGAGVGNAGYAMTVDATQSPGGVDLPKRPFAQTASLAVAFWFYPSAAQADIYNAMVYRQTMKQDTKYGADRAYAVWWIQGGVHVVYTLAGGTAQYVCTNQSFGLAAETWHHFALTFDSKKQTASVYLDGARVKRCPYTGGMLTDGYRELVLGEVPKRYRGQPEASSFTGSLDNVRFYRRNLSASEVQELYANDE
jgi:hypothetical protein